MPVELHSNGTTRRAQAGRSHSEGEYHDWFTLALPRLQVLWHWHLLVRQAQHRTGCVESGRSGREPDTRIPDPAITGSDS
jgi:hypothetical protein